MAEIKIPGHRLSSGEEITTDWVNRGGDCVLFRVEVMFAAGGGETMSFLLETRGEDATSSNGMVVTAGDPEVSSAGFVTCLFLATPSTSPGNGVQEQVRVVITVKNEVGNDYYIVRIHPLIFFDSAKAY